MVAWHHNDGHPQALEDTKCVGNRLGRNGQRVKEVACYEESVNWKAVQGVLHSLQSLEARLGRSIAAEMQVGSVEKAQRVPATV